MEFVVCLMTYPLNMIVYASKRLICTDVSCCTFTFQILNVYITDYDSGGKYWPIVQNSAIFSLVVAQVIAIGVFVLKKSTVCFGFTIPLVICTLLFNEYCRRRFLPVFKTFASEVRY